MSTPVEISNLRISIQQVKTSLIDTIHRERNYETFLREAQDERRHLQSYLTTLEVKLAEMENRVVRPSKNTRKVVEKAVDDASMAFLKSLSPEDKEALVASLMAGLPK